MKLSKEEALALLGGGAAGSQTNQPTSAPQQTTPSLPTAAPQPTSQSAVQQPQPGKLSTQDALALLGAPQPQQQAAQNPYANITSAADFQQYAAQGAGMAGENPKAGYFGENINLFGWKPFEQEVQNKVLYAKQKYAEANNEQNKILQMGNASAVQPLSEEQLAYVQMSDDETAIYNYLLAKNGTAEADKYLEKIREELNARAATQTVDSATALNSKLPIVGEAATNLGFMAGEGLKGFVRGFTNLAANEAPAVSQSEYAASLARDNLADTLGKLPQAFGDTSGGQFAGDILQTVGNMTIPIVTSYVLQGLGVPAPIAEGIASAAMGVSSGSNARVEALRQGYTNDQASLYGALVGASETGFQYLFTGIGALGGKLTGITAGAATKNVSSALLKTATTLGVKMAGEGFEEYLQEVLEPVYRNLAFGENNEVVLNSPNSLYALFVGVVTAGLLEGPSVISNNVTASRAGNAIVQSGHYDTLIDNALQLNPKTDAHKKAKALSSSAKQNSLAAGELLIAYQKDGGDLSFMREPATPAEQFQSVVEGATPEAQAAVDEANALINSGDREAGVAAIKEAARINAQAEVAESRGEIVQPVQPIQQPMSVLPTQTSVQAPTSPVGSVSSNSGINTPVDANAAVANAGELVQGVIGKSGTALTNDNKQINFNYAVVPADSLITSNDISGNVNPNYPQELQPRDRTRVSSIVDISKIANDLQPARLGADATVQNGAPIVGSDGIVESGNARTIAINLAYRTGKADAYKQFILDNAAQFGIDSSNIPENPVLVRVRTSEVNRADFTRNANESTVAAYSDYEVAQQDAKKLTPDVLSLFVPNDNGNINSLDNRNFIRRFISEVVPSTERGNVVTETGDLSQSGLQRIRNAIFQRAYNNAELGKRLTELIDDDAKTLMRALINSAPNAVSLVSGIESGYYYPLNIANDISSAAEKYVQLREQNKSVYDYLVQASFVSDISPEVSFLLSVIEANAKKRRHVVLTTFMNAVYDRVVSMGDPNQVSLFNDVAYATKGEILNAAKAKYERDNGKILEGHESEYGQGTLFSELAFQNAQQTENEREVAASASVQKVTEPAPEQPRVQSNLTQGSSVLPTNKALSVQNNSSALPSVLPNNDGLGAKTSEFVPERKTSKVYENTYMNTDVFAEADKAMMDESDYEYDVVSERQSMNVAAQRLYSDFDGEIEDLISRDVRLWSGEDVDTAMGALSQLSENDPRRAQLRKQLQKAGTEAGRMAQAFAKYTRTKEGALIQAKRVIASYKADALAAKGQKWMDRHEDAFVLTPEEEYDITHNAEIAETLPVGRDKYILYAKNKAIADSFQYATLGKKVMAIMRIKMLLNFKTQMRNIKGNGAIIPVNLVADLIRTPLDIALSKRSGVRTAVLPNAITAVKGFAQGAVEGVQDYRMNIDTSPTALNRWEIERSGSARAFNPRFANTKLGKAALIPLNGIDRFLSFVMSEGDRPFYQAAYNNSLSQQMKANHTDTPTADMIDIARTEAAQRTWNDTNEFTKFVIQLRDGLNNIGNKTGKKREFGFGSILVPFAKTPANLVKALLDYSPVGLVSNVLLQDVSTYNRALRGDGNISVARAQFELVNDFGKAIAGSLVMTLGYFLAAAGLIRGGNDDDKDKSFFERYVLGLQPYSFKIGDKTFTYDWMQPVGTSFAIMADFHKLLSEGNTSQFGLDVLGTVGNAILSALSAGGNVLFEQSFLQGIQSMFDADGVVQGLIEVATNTPNMFMSTLVRQVGQYIDDTARTSFTYNNVLDTAKRKVMSSLPWAVSKLEPIVDPLGNEVKRSNGENTLWNVFFNPSNVSKNISDKTAKALYALYEITGDKTIFPRVAPYYLEDKNGNKKVLTPEQRTKYQKAIGDQTWKAFTDALNSSEYAKLSNKQKAKVFSDIVSHVNTMVEKDFLKEGYTPELQKIADAIKSGHPMAEYVIAKMLINGATAPAGSPNGTSAAQKSKVINEYAGLSESSKYYYMKMENQSAAKAEEKGVSFDLYATYMQAYTGFTGEDKNSDGRADTNSRKKQAIAWMKAQGYDAATINALLYVGDWKPDYKG